MEDKTKESLIKELQSTVTGTDIKDTTGSRYEAMTRTLTDKPIDESDIQKIPEKQRIEVSIDKELYHDLVDRKCSCILAKANLHVGDTLVIREIDGFTQTGTFMIQNVDYVLKMPGLKEGYSLGCWKI